MAKKRDHKIMITDEAIHKVNEANSLKDLQKAADIFLKNSYNVGIDYEDR